MYWGTAPDMSVEDAERCGTVGCTITHADMFSLDGGGACVAVHKAEPWTEEYRARRLAELAHPPRGRRPRGSRFHVAGEPEGPLNLFLKGPFCFFDCPRPVNAYFLIIFDL